MIYREDNGQGAIEVNLRVVESLCGRVIDGFDGRVIVSDPRGKFRRGAERNPEEGSGFVKARVKEGRLNLQLFLIFKFGTSVRESASVLAKRLRAQIPLDIGIEAGFISMVFVGTLSEKLSKRRVIFVDDGGGELREVENGET
ncbi:MAG: hypothetical protein LBS85_00895 [Clostridiales Family XIII bacterium]|jgi:uncharacterized alkaline shock family protein YloU|nr:hypothetical protein [Clostridiales Family XIII bacterium]